MNYNKVILVGRISQDPEDSFTPDGIQKTVFSLAVNRPKSREGTETADFFRITTWRKTAEFCSKYLKKGRLIMVEGSLRLNKWTTKEGENRSTIDIIGQNVLFMEKRPEGDWSAPPQAAPRDEDLLKDAEEVVEPGDNGDIPF